MAKNCLVFITVLIGQKEGLPNIEGTFTAYHPWWQGGINNSNGTGAFEFINKSRRSNEGVNRTDSGDIIFNAALYNQIYGSSDHVTPCNATIKIWKRVS